MKKFIVLATLFVSAACFITAGLYINKKQAGITVQEEEVVSKVISPELLSDIKMSSYVSLPASFSDVDVIEDLDNIDVTEENVDDVMYAQLFGTASHLAVVDSENILIVADYTITKDGEVKKVESGKNIGYSKNNTLFDSKMYKELKGSQVGKTVHVEGVTFDGVEDAVVDMTILDIYNMPFPVTDKYISENSEYKNIYDMRAALMNDSSGEAKKKAREITISNLIDTMMNQTTFIKLPESLINKELESLQKEDKGATYEEAKHNLYKIFFISAMIDNYDIATMTDMEKRFNALEEDEREGLTDYEIERKKYLLFEEDVVTCLYKKIDIKQGN